MFYGLSKYHTLPNVLFLFVCMYAAYGCLAASFSGDAAVPLMRSPITNKLILILPTSEEWQAESTHLVLIQRLKEALTQDPKTLSQPP